ncbi:MAG: nitroreductase family protein [Bacteroidales bacterium]|jgi:nitroreductase/Na+-translocating ferredoxin:NAD+ oxidoreductase RnfG subunit
MSYKKLLKIFVLLSGLAVVVISSGKIFNYSLFEQKDENEKTIILDSKTSFFPDYYNDFDHFKYDTLVDCYYIYNSDDKEIGRVIFTSPMCDEISGFGGPVPFAILLDEANKIKALHLFDNNETPSWIENLKKSGFFDSWNGLTLNEALEKKVDAVSGSTMSSSAVIESFNKRVSAYAACEEKQKKTDWVNFLGLILSFIILLFAVLSFVFSQKMSNLRIFLLLGLVGILGFWQGKFLSMALLHNWLISGINIKFQVFIFIVLFLSILLPLITNRSFYCNFVCPYGAVQELAGKITKNKIQIDRGLRRILKSLRYVFLFVIMILIVVGTDIVLEDFEPFGAFKFQFASLTTLVLAVLFLFLSVIIDKPWCRFFCPTGAFLSMLRANANNKEKKMSLQTLLNIILALSLIVMIYFNFLKPSTKTNVNDTVTKKNVIMSNNTLDVIHSRKSVRHFTGEQVNKEQLETIVKAGMAAPSARNLQPWAFIVITERERLDKLADLLPYAKMLKTASAAIVVCGDLSKAATDVDQAYWVQDCSAASQNILLAVESLGLGAVWTAVYPYEDRMKPVIEELKLPENIIPLNVIPIGYSTGEDKPKDKWKPENLHWNQW